jgi:hypothetical protein
MYSQAGYGAGQGDTRKELEEGEETEVINS